ncbi:hypothetical protein GY45DRAFT_651865 [Cubamyces sp. BRFM 1775]|nr:hypothetical protein GY45DRAFT_651865 [Cubamyces sp. BRFM 1775]
MSTSAVKDPIPRPKSPLTHSTADNKPSPRARAGSSAKPPSPDKSESSHGFKSRFGWSFPQKRVPLPPLELDEDSPRKPPPRPSSRSSLAAIPSHIPVRSPRKNGASQNSPSLWAPSLLG